MTQSLRPQARETGQIVDFDEAMLEACTPEVRAELISEASLLAHAFAPEGRRDELESMADALTRGARDDEMGRAHARRLAAALRHLARGGDA